ncbi:MAG: hypothetical protein ACK5G7_02510 [Erysipelotrichaceae bacterium]
MIKNDLYKLNSKGLDFLKENGTQIVKNTTESKLQNRPMFFFVALCEHSKIIYSLPLVTINIIEKI